MIKVELIKHFVEVALKAVNVHGAEVTIQNDYDPDIEGAVVVNDGDFVLYSDNGLVKTKTPLGIITNDVEMFHLHVAHFTPGNYHNPPDVDIEELQFTSLAKALDEMCKRILDNTISNIALDIEYAKDEESGYFDSL